MEGLVQDLEIEAERRRRGEGGGIDLALRVEVFETLDEPRTRIWDRVYKDLYLDGGRYLATFDRQTLAETISGQLKPVTRPDGGGVVEKSVEQCVRDVRSALVDLGQRRLRPAILGDEVEPGLDLGRGLAIEARLMLRPRPGEMDLRDDDVAAYQEKKLRSLAQLAGVIARVDTAAFAALDDGVKPNRTRQLILGGSSDGRSAQRFEAEIKRVLSEGGRQVKAAYWHDPRLAIVHDVELPIPIYYVMPVTGEIEDAYLKAAADTQRAYDLHTDYKWEKSLANLNPRGSEIAVGWALDTLATGLLVRVIKRDVGTGQWLWERPDEEPVGLEGSLSAALYKLSDIHRRKAMSAALREQMDAAAARMTPEHFTERRQELVASVKKVLVDIEHRESEGQFSRDDLLDAPIWQALRAALERSAPPRVDPAAPTRKNPFGAFG